MKKKNKPHTWQMKRIKTSSVKRSSRNFRRSGGPTSDLSTEYEVCGQTLQMRRGTPERAWGELFRCYLDDFRSRQLSYVHERRNMKLFSDLYAHIEKSFKRPPFPWDLKPDFVRTWLNSHGWSVNTVHGRGHAVLSLFKIGWEYRVLTERPQCLSLKPPKKERMTREVLTPDELRKLRDSLYGVSKVTRTVLRDRVVFELCLLGLRASELAVLKWSDLKEDHFEIRIPKTRKVRSFPIDSHLKKALLEWSPACPKSTRYVMKYEVPFEGDSPLPTSSIACIVRRMLKRAGIVRDSYSGPHLFRHSVATILYRETEDLERVRSLLGHRYLDTTRGYVHVAPAELETSLSSIKSSFSDLREATPISTEARDLWGRK